MADSNVIDIVIRARDESSAALRATQAAIDEVARAQAALAAAERAKADADRAAASGSDDQAEALRRQAAAAEAAAAAERRLAEAERAAAAAAARIRGAGGGGGAPPPGGGAGGGGGPDADRLSRVLDGIVRDLGGFGEQVKALVPVLNQLKTTTTATTAAIAAAGGRLGRGGGPVPPVPPRPPPPGPNPPPGPGPNPPPPPPPPGGGRDAQARQTLIANLMDVTTQLAGGANPMLILIQQGPALAAAIASASSASALFSGILASMKAALVSASAVIAPLLVALAAAGTAYLIAKNATEEANEAQGIYNVNVEDAEAKLSAMAERLDEVNGMLGKVKDRTKENAREIAVLTGEITKEEASRQKAVETVQEQAKTETEAARQRLKAQMDLVHVQENQLKLEEQRSSGIIGKEAREELRENIRVGKEQIEVLKGDLDARKAATAKELEQIDTLARLREEQAAETGGRKRSTAAIRQQAAALTELQQAVKGALPVLAEALDQADLFDSLRAFVPDNFIGADAIDRARELGDALQALAPSKNVLTDLERLQLLLLDIQRANIDSGGRLGGLESDASAAYASAEKAITDAIPDGLAEAAREMQGAMDAIMAPVMQQASTVGSKIGAIIGGDISGLMTDLLSAAGPIGAAIGGMLGGLAALGEQGAGKTTKMITGYVDAIMKGITSLPQLFVKLIPDLVVSLVTEFIPALIGMLPRLMVALAIELPIAIVRGYVKWWRDIGGFKGIARSIADGVREWWTSTWDRIKAWVRDIFRPNEKNAGANSRNMTDEQRQISADLARNNPLTSSNDMRELALGSSRSRSSGPGGNAARAQAPTIVLQGDLTPDFVPALGRRLDRYNGPGGLRAGTTILGSN